MKKLLGILVLGLFLFNFKVYAGVSCKTTGCPKYPRVTKITGIPFGISDFQKSQGKKPFINNYYIFHFKPLEEKPSPYVILIPSSGGISHGSRDYMYRYSKDFLNNGFGAVIVDIFYNTKVKKGTLARGPLSSMASLSTIKYIEENFPNYTNGKFGITGGSRGGMTVLSLAGDLIRENFLFENVKSWFDAGAAFYPSCGKQHLTMPVVIFIGEKDDWLSAASCRSMESRSKEQIDSGMLKIYIYEDAHHSFNNRRHKKAYKVTAKGHDYPGHTLKYNKKADLHSQQTMLEFFTKHLYK